MFDTPHRIPPPPGAVSLTDLSPLFALPDSASLDPQYEKLMAYAEQLARAMERERSLELEKVMNVVFGYRNT